MADEMTAYSPPDAGIDASIDKAMGAVIGTPNDNALPEVSHGRLNAYDQIEKQETDEAKAKKSAEKRATKKADAKEAAKKGEGRSKRDLDADMDDALDGAFEKERGLRAAAGETAKPKDPKEKSYSAKGHEDKEIVDGIFDRAFEKSVKGKSTGSIKDFAKPEIRKLREEIKSRYPGHKLSDLMKTMEKWEEGFKKDAIGTREAIMQAYLQVSPQNFSENEPKKYHSGLSGSVDKAVDDALDLRDLDEYVQKYGDNLPHILRQCAQFDRDMIDDPVGTSARLAANYGALRPVAQQQQPQAETIKPVHERTRDEDNASVSKALELLTQKCNEPNHEWHMPGFDRDDVQNVSTPERSCIGSPERICINDSGKKAPELGAFS